MKKWIICSGPDWYRPSVTSTKQIIQKFHEDDYAILWINPIAFKSPFVNSVSRTSVRIKIKDKLKTHLRFLSRKQKQFWVWVPFYFPLFSGRSDHINEWLVKIQFYLVRFILRISLPDSLLWISGSFTSSGLLTFPFHCKVYQAADLMSDFRGCSDKLRQILKTKEAYLCSQTDIRFASSEKIAEKLKILCGKKVDLLLHGVDFEHFADARGIHPRLQEIRNIDKPIAGYFGSLSDANDKDVFIKLAENDFSVVLIGKVLGDYSLLQQNKNIFLLGPVSYDELPNYAKGFDVALLNWRMHEWIENCFPVKAPEYLALGLPVVSCKIPVLMEYFSEHISFANTTEEFVREARRLVSEDTADLRIKRQDAVRNWSWGARFATIKERLAL